MATSSKTLELVFLLQCYWSLVSRVFHPGPFLFSASLYTAFVDINSPLAESTERATRCGRKVFCLTRDVLQLQQEVKST